MISCTGAGTNELLKRYIAQDILFGRMLAFQVIDYLELNCGFLCIYRKCKGAKIHKMYMYNILQYFIVETIF